MWTSGTIIISIITLSGVTNLFFAVYSYIKNPKSAVNRNFFYFGLATALWCFANASNLAIRNLFWLRATTAIGFFVLITALFFAFAMAEKKLSKVIKIFLLILGSAVFLTNLFTPLLIKDILSFTDFGYRVTFGSFLVLWAILEILCILIALFIPVSFLKKADQQKKKQISFFLAGATIFALWFIIVGVVLPLLGYSQFSELGAPASIFLIGFAYYSITKYNLVNIGSLIFPAITYSVIIISIIAFLLLLLFVSSFFFSHLLVWPVYVLIVLVSLVLFFVGRLFFKEKKDLEQAKISLIKLLRRSEENRIRAEIERDKTTTIVSNFSDGLIILDEKDNVFAVNPEAEKILKIDEQELLGKHLASTATLPKTKAVMSVLSKRLKAVYRRPVKLADNLIIEVSAITLASAGKNLGHLIVLHDITREKMVEKMKTEFVSLAAHQLRTPLSIIKWSISMLDKGDFGKLTKKQSEVVKNTFHSNERLIALVNSLLNITRMEDGRYIYKLVKSDISEIINTALDSYKGEADKKKLKIEYKKEKNLPKIMADREKVRIVIQNLIDNAIKYSSDSGKIKITLSKEGKNIKFEVKDFGIGIPKPQQNKIFQKFFRADNAVTMNTSGSGLGLFLSKNIVESHGGKISFTSKENEGTTFCFSLPIK